MPAPVRLSHGARSRTRTPGYRNRSRGTLGDPGAADVQPAGSVSLRVAVGAMGEWEVERRRDRREVGQDRELGLGSLLGGEAEHAFTNGQLANALAELVDDARGLVTHGLR
jgi:hypothetical protein